VDVPLQGRLQRLGQLAILTGPEVQGVRRGRLIDRFVRVGGDAIQPVGAVSSPNRVDVAPCVVVPEVVVPDQGIQNLRIALRRPGQEESLEIDPTERVTRPAPKDVPEVDEDLVSIVEVMFHDPNRRVLWPESMPWIPHATLTEQRSDEPALLREAAGTHV
jgi:hypothetical protein